MLADRDAREGLESQLRQATAELARGLRAGEPCRAEDFLLALPDLAGHADSAIELIYTEFVIRQELGQCPCAADWFARFPQWRDRLERLFRVDEMLGQADSSAAGTAFLAQYSDGPGSRQAEAPTCLGRYRILAKLGSGGFGVVYKAYDSDLRREVAIKVPRRDRLSSPEDAEAFLSEARLLASLKHPGIVPIYDLGRTEDGLCYLVSRWMEGHDLAQRMRQGRLSHAAAADLIARVAEALHYAHQHGLVHRDIKPANILLDGDGHPLVADFGVALRDADFGTGPNFAGTPAYMSPEQARGEGHRVDARSDVYSLGAVLYELLTGTRPFRADSARALREQIKTQEPRPPRQLDDSIPKELDRICLKALSKRAADRYSTAMDWAEDLRQWQAGDKSQPAVRVQVVMPPAPAGEGSAPGSALAASPAGPAPSDSDRRPIKVVPKGLRSFDAEDAEFFLELLPGPRHRDGLPDSIRFWKARVEAADPERAFSIGLIYGPSGCGKSSLVKAGLLPRLAGHVLPVYVEATSSDTEARLLQALYKRCPDLSTKPGLAEALASLRRRQGLPSGKKLLVVLDQFEQWLHAHRDEPNPELVQALRQCDAEHLQCLVLVRDDFWMATTRFMRDVEVPLLEGHNSAAVDLFDPRHARKVLAAFGRAFGALPEGEPAPEEPGRWRLQDAGRMTTAQASFLDQAVAGLAQDGKVVSVRLALFAEMVKGKPWTPATLKELGGMQGIGVTFLDETFSAKTAPPQHRLHEKAARAVLNALLPEQGTDLKGQQQSHQTLLEASGYAQQPREFNELLAILDTELRLVTPTDPAAAGDRYYQLTHDYLVPALQQWLKRKQRETWRGRAELRLAERAGSWTVKPERRYLPSWWEWAAVLLFTKKRDWTRPQRKMMAAARRYHAIRGLIAAAVLLLATLISLEIQRTIHAGQLVSQLLDADIHRVPAIIDALQGYRRWTDPKLAQIADDPGRPPSERLRASLALVPADEGRVDYLLSYLPKAELDELLVIRKLLEARRGELVDRLWVLVRGDVIPVPQDQDQGELLRLACVLAAYDPDSGRWQSTCLGADAAEQLVQGSLLSVKEWSDALRPARRHLLGQLRAAFQDREPDRSKERLIATSVLADYASDDPQFLLELVKDADYQQYAELFPKLEPYRQQALAGMTDELDKSAPAQALWLPLWGFQAALVAPLQGPLQYAALQHAALQPVGGPLVPLLLAQRDLAADMLAKRQANAAVTLYRLGKVEPVWPLLRHSPDPSARSYLIHYLNPLGADPQPLVKRWYDDDEQDVSAQRALILSLGEFNLERQRLSAKLVEVYETHPDPGVHSAAEWLLRKWGAGEQVQRIEGQLKGKPAEKGRSWYVNAQGQTMVVLDPRDKPVALSHNKEIRRPFAIATKEVSVEQFLRFRPAHPYNRQSSPERNSPVNKLTWFDAAAYCRWLSEKEEIPETEMCYPPIDQIKEGMEPVPDYLTRTGYRLPTEAEWEYACRAGATTARYFGKCDELLPKYAWYDQNSKSPLFRSVAPFSESNFGLFPMHGVGLLKPNDFGLFDMHGNAFEWCQERKHHNVKSGVDSEDTAKVQSNVARVLRGGSARYPAEYLRSDFEGEEVPTVHWDTLSFRVARTQRP